MDVPFFKKKDKEPIVEPPESKPVVEAQPSTTPQGPITLSFEQLQMLMNGMAQTIVEGMKKPTESELAKMKKEQEDAVSRMKARAEVGKAEELRRKGEQANCPHKCDDGKTWAVGGQKFSDGNLKLFCQRCQKMVYDGACPPELEGGVISSRLQLNIPTIAN